MKTCIHSMLLSLIVAWALPCHPQTANQGQAQDPLLEPRELWRTGDYGDAIEKLLSYRKTSYGRNVEVDYMLATSFCQLPKLVADGRKLFSWILYAYSVDPATRKTMLAERKSCGIAGHQPMQLEFSSNLIKMTVGVRGKTFFYNVRAADVPLTSDRPKVLRETPREKFQERLFTSAELDGAKHYATAQLPNLKVYTEGHFVVATAGPQTIEQLATMLRQLDQFAEALHTTFGVELPHYLITIYLVPSQPMLRQLAITHHGIDIGRSSIGYSVQDDLTISAYVPGVLIGTIKHELFHLTVRNRFGDIPAWLDEGIAALCEQSTVVSGQIVGQDNWRRNVLTKFWDSGTASKYTEAVRPSLDRLVQMDWQHFDDEQWSHEGEFQAADIEVLDTVVDNYDQKAANHATARYFMLFLQHKGSLRSVMDSMQSLDPRQMSEDPSARVVDVVESATHQPMSRMDAEFSSWFTATAPGPRTKERAAER